MRKVIVAFFVFSFFPLSSPVSAQVEVEFYGLSSFQMPIGGEVDEFSFKWTRLGFNAYPSDYLQITGEYELATSELKYSYARLHHEIEFLQGAEGSLLFGQFLGAIPYLYPGPKTIQLTNWPATINGYSIYTAGVSAWLGGENYTFRATAFKNDNAQAALTVKGVSVFWQKKVGRGFIIEPAGLFGEKLPSFIHPTVGGAETSGRKLGFVQEYVQFSHNVRFYIEWNLREEEENYLLAGLSLTYSTNSFFKVFYDGDKESFLTEVTFSF